MSMNCPDKSSYEPPTDVPTEINMPTEQGLVGLASGEKPATFGLLTEAEAMKRLLEAQEDRLPGIIEELERGHKTGHWIWYVFPTTKPGLCDPRDTYVTESTVHSLFENAGLKQKWQKALELICDQVETDGIQALPEEDHGRIHYFLKEWRNLNHGIKWMAEILMRLGKEEWKRS